MQVRRSLSGGGGTGQEVPEWGGRGTGQEVSEWGRVQVRRSLSWGGGTGQEVSEWGGGRGEGRCGLEKCKGNRF